MPIKGSGSAELREIDRWDNGVGWIAHPDEEMRRASHALATDEGVYLLDPVDAEGLDDLIAEFGEVAGVLILLDRHKRDAATVASRHDAPVHVPSWMTGVASRLDARVERFDDTLGDTGYDVRRVVDNPMWQEAALYRESDGTLYVPESLGTAGFFRAGSESVGVHPVRRLTPPRSLSSLSVDRLLVGHGEGVSEGAEEAIGDAVSNSVRRAPTAFVGMLKGLLT